MTGIRELKTNLVRYLQETQSGSTILVTEHHRPVVALEPDDAADMALEDRIDALRDAGILEWNGQKIDVSTFQPVPKLREDVLAVDLLLEDRD
jgi:antitoxin (DNA-binding transcriptional repressor) of toxin-antitoxin stability system